MKQIVWEKEEVDRLEFDKRIFIQNNALLSGSSIRWIKYHVKPQARGAFYFRGTRTVETT